MDVWMRLHGTAQSAWYRVLQYELDHGIHERVRVHVGAVVAYVCGPLGPCVDIDKRTPRKTKKEREREICVSTMASHRWSVSCVDVPPTNKTRGFDCLCPLHGQTGTEETRTRHMYVAWTFP